MRSSNAHVRGDAVRDATAPVAVDAITTRTSVTTATSVVGIIRFLMQTLLRDAGSPAAAGRRGSSPILRLLSRRRLGVGRVVRHVFSISR